MPVETKEYPADFYSRKFSVIVVNRKDDSKPKTFAEYADSVNLRLSFIQSLTFMLGELNEKTIEATNPTNLKTHIGDVIFLIMSFAASLHLDDDLENFLKDFE